MNNYEIVKQFYMEEFKSIDEMDEENILDSLNHGYYPSYQQYENEIFKYGYSLYHHMLQGLNINGGKILDVGCGRGGSSKVFKNFKFDEMHGCDINPFSIEFCKKKFSNISNMQFRVDDATNLSYEDSYFDYVINVESSHCYSDINKFFKEVKRILKPNGIFLYADICASLERHLSKDLNFFKYIIREDITKNVAMACEQQTKIVKNFEDSDLKTYLIETVYLGIGRKMLYETKNATFIKYTCCDQATIQQN